MDKGQLENLYVVKGMSAAEIAVYLGYSIHKIDYWLNSFGIIKRSISEAQYVKHNGLSDPFHIKSPLSNSDQRLYGLGVGIYWGEGNKRNLNAVRVGNTYAQLVKVFVEFLVKICEVKLRNIRYGLQLFSDVEESEALAHWQGALNISRNQIMPTVSRIKSGKIGTYKTKNQFGVMTVYVFNTKLRNWLVQQLVVPR